MVSSIGLKDAKDAADALQAAVLAATGVDLFNGPNGLPRFWDGKISFIKALRQFTQDYANEYDERERLVESVRESLNTAIARYAEAEREVRALRAHLDRLTER
jgi:hypothetical protein